MYRPIRFSCGLLIGCATACHPVVGAKTPDPSSADRADPPPPPQWRTLMDGREERPIVDDKAVERAMEALIAKGTIDWHCDENPEPTPPPEASPITCIRGAFVTPGSKESACVVGVECHDHRAGHDYSKKRLVVFDATHVVLDAEVDGAIVRAAPDLDGDGTNEIILIDGYAWQGVSASHMELASLAGRRLTRVKRFALGAEATCGMPMLPMHEDEPVFFWKMSEGHLHFREELYTRKCDLDGNHRNWSLHRTKEDEAR